MAIASAVGKLAQTTYAALRAGVARIHEHPSFTDITGEPLSCLSLSWLSKDIDDLEPEPTLRIHRAAEIVVDHLMKLWPSVGPLEVMVTSGDSWRAPIDGLDRIIRPLLPPVHATDHRIHVFGEGHAGGLLAMHQLATIASETGHVLGLVIGADSLIHLPTLRTLDGQNRLRRHGRPRGLIPGEAVAALLVCDLPTAQRHQLPVWAVVPRLSIAREPATILDDTPPLASALTSCLRSVLEGQVLPTTLDVYCDLNGEPYRAHEWMQASMRVLEYDHQLHHPADCIGDIGAAASPLLLALGALCLPERLGWPARDLALVSCSSDGGLRGAALIKSPTLTGLRARTWR